jgi:hypothetical protein
LCTAEVSIGDTGEFKVSVIGTPQRVEMIRVATLDSDGNLSAKQSETVSKLVDQMLIVLRLTYDPAADLVRFGDNTISLGAHDKDGQPSLGVNITEMMERQRPPVAADNIRNVFIASMPHRHLFKLLGDAQLSLLPMQYRFLSLYKILELEFRFKRKWQGLQQLLEPYEKEYKAMNVSPRGLVNLLHDMRDRCAHIKVGGDDSLGIVGLDGPDPKIVVAMVPFLLRVIAIHLTTKYTGLTFQLPAWG